MEIATLVLYNIAFFGSIFLFSKAIEAASWYVICNYEDVVKKFKR